MTVRWMKWLRCGVEDTWHSYIPESLCCGYLIWSVQSSECGWWMALNLWSLVYVYLPTVSRCTSLCRTQDTCRDIWNVNSALANWISAVNKKCCNHGNPSCWACSREVSVANTRTDFRIPSDISNVAWWKTTLLLQSSWGKQDHL